MAVKEYLIFVCTLSCLCCVSCELNLNEDEPCITKGLNGTCVGIFRCPTASLTYIYANAGANVVKYNYPELPDICSYKNNEPVVCCTDCDVSENEPFRNTALRPNSYNVSENENSIAWAKCSENYMRLPYPCRENPGFYFRKIWKEDKKCHGYSSKFFGSGGGGVGGRDAQRWEFPHMALIGYGDDVESAEWLCGGTVISENFILTAGHCTFISVLFKDKCVSAKWISATSYVLFQSLNL